jgi:SAM-dependent methyltransferase
MEQSIDVFVGAKKYEFGMGAWSKLLAPLFIEFIGGVEEGDRVLDVGCGTGSLALAIAETTKAAKIAGVDPSTGFIEYARKKTSDPRVRFDTGDAQRLPYENGSFDKCLASLIITFVPDAPRAASEMRRVTQSGGIVATCMWDSRGGGMEVFETFWSAALALDPEVGKNSSRRRPYTTEGELSDLWRGVELERVETDALTIPLRFNSFDALWAYHAKGEGPSSNYTRSLALDHQRTLENRLRKDILGDRPDGAFSLQAKAWAVRGIVP